MIAIISILFKVFFYNPTKLKDKILKEGVIVFVMAHQLKKDFLYPVRKEL